MMRVHMHMAGWTLCALCLLQGPALGDTDRHARFQKVRVLPLSIEPVPFPDSPQRPDREPVLRRLAEEATARAERTLLKQHLAQSVERTASPEAAALVLTGTVQLPVSLPVREQGSRAMFRPGEFARAHVELRRRDGTLLAAEQATLEWDDVRWVRGTHQNRRARELDEVLGDAVRKVVDRAVKRFRRPPSQSPTQRD